MKIKFKNGYTVEVDNKHLSGLTKAEVVNMAKNLVNKSIADSKKINDMFEPIDTFKTFDFLNKTRNGFKVVKAYADTNDNRMHVIAYRPDDDSYIICLGYNADDGTWNQGRYDYTNFGNAEADLKHDYDVEEFELSSVNTEDGCHTEDACGAKPVKDTPIEFTEELGFATTPISIGRKVSKKDGHILDPISFSKLLDYLETDLDYDLETQVNSWVSGEGYTSPQTINKIVNKYGEFKKELELVDDEDFNDRVDGIIIKIDELTDTVNKTTPAATTEKTEETVVEEPKVVEAKKEPEQTVVEETKVEEVKEEPKPAPKQKPVIVKTKTVEKKTAPKPIEQPKVEIKKEVTTESDEDLINVDELFSDFDDEVTDSVAVKDVPVGGETIHASVEPAPGTSFNKTMIVRGNSRALSPDDDESRFGRRLLLNEFDDVKKTLEYDIKNAATVKRTTPKHLLHLGMDKYKELIEYFNVPGLESKYNELKTLYNDLFYNGYYLGMR